MAGRLNPKSRLLLSPLLAPLPLTQAAHGPGQGLPAPRRRASWWAPVPSHQPCLVSCSRVSQSALRAPRPQPHPGSGPTWSQRGLVTLPLGCWILIGSGLFSPQPSGDTGSSRGPSNFLGAGRRCTGNSSLKKPVPGCMQATGPGGGSIGGVGDRVVLRLSVPAHCDVRLRGAPRSCSGKGRLARVPDALSVLNLSLCL